MATAVVEDDSPLDLVLSSHGGEPPLDAALFWPRSGCSPCVIAETEEFSKTLAEPADGKLMVLASDKAAFVRLVAEGLDQDQRPECQRAASMTFGHPPLEIREFTVPPRKVESGYNCDRTVVPRAANVHPETLLDH
jgi:hypothetical protein